MFNIFLGTAAIGIWIAMLCVYHRDKLAPWLAAHLRRPAPLAPEDEGGFITLFPESGKHYAPPPKDS